MPTLKGGYYLHDGTRVPSVTTVISRFRESGGLIAWAHRLGLEGKDYREERDAAASAGTMAHAAVEAWIHKQEFKFEGDPEICDRAARAYGAFLDWAQQTRLEITHTETPLISEKHRYGGTFDGAILNNGRGIVDWKTSAALYPENLIQVAAYGKLWEEHFPDDPITAGFHVCLFSREFGDFHHHFYAELDTAWEAFLHLRALYQLDRELKQRTK